MTISILYFTPENYPTFRVDVNILFGKYLPQHDIYSDIVAGKKSNADALIAWGGGETYLVDVPVSSIKKHIILFIHNVKHLFKINTAKHQAIQVRDMPIFALLGLLAAKLTGVKFFYWMSYPIPEGHILLAGHRKLSEGFFKFLIPWIKGHVGHFLLYRVVLPRADHVFVQSDWMKENLTKYGISPEKMTPVPMGIDIEALRLNNVAPLDDSRLVRRRVIVYLGTFDAPRKIEVLFEMLSILKDQFPTVLLVLVGDDVDSQTQRQWLRRKAEELHISDHLLWTGWLPRDEAWRYVCSAEVALSPIPRGYLLDCSSPTKLPEYFALGVPVVCSDNPDQEQVIKQSGAGICVLYTAENFANATIKMLSLNESERNEIVRKGKEYVDQYRSYFKISRDLADVYKKILSNDQR